jgi:flagellar protein FliS
MDAGEIADRLSQLYEYEHHLLLRANVEKDPEPVREVTRLVTQMRDAWAQAAAQVAWPAAHPNAAQPGGTSNG